MNKNSEQYCRRRRERRADRKKEPRMTTKWRDRQRVASPPPPWKNVARAMAATRRYFYSLPLNQEILYTDWNQNKLGFRALGIRFTITCFLTTWLFKTRVFVINRYVRVYIRRVRYKLQGFQSASCDKKGEFPFYVFRKCEILHFESFLVSFYATYKLGLSIPAYFFSGSELIKFDLLKKER